MHVTEKCPRGRAHRTAGKARGVEVRIPTPHLRTKHTTVGATVFVALDNAFAPTTNPHGTILANYGDNYQFPTTVKQEDTSDHVEMLGVGSAFAHEPSPPTRAPHGVSGALYQRTIDTDGAVDATP
ncbi:hypothetical protein DMC64_20245 [Amycolatopsis sp. WAC 04197]|uniref:hypothetical protein n=1 Tax=Amycolatopsis sp. WAC 04197 TaxID=2203199 RepID=UPI000F78C499|nr:hypothetical protein [Amycolatopsis sp. WAC 04197]RSN45173.1 hypothetical protein DMC64_20245 [Amycolatopsis sp. WAC 04197]